MTIIPIFGITTMPLPTIWTADGHTVNGSPTRTFLGSGDWYVEDRLAGDTGDGSLGDLVPSAVTQTGGFLQITGTDVGVGNSPRGRRYTSGELQLSTMAFTGGTFEARIKFGPVAGCNGAFWLLGQNCQQTLKTTEDNTGICNWPNAGSREIDLAELLTGNSTQINCQIHTDVSNAVNLYTPGVDPTAGFHTYKTVWTPGVSVVSFFDGSHIGSDIVTGNVPNEPMFLILDFWIGPLGASVSASLPANMLIDYVSVT